MGEANLLEKVEELRELTEKLIVVSAQCYRAGDFVTVVKELFIILGEFAPVEEEHEEDDTTTLRKDQKILLMFWDADSDIWGAWVVDTYYVIQVKPKQIIGRVL